MPQSSCIRRAAVAAILSILKIDAVRAESVPSPSYPSVPPVPSSAPAPRAPLEAGGLTPPSMNTSTANEAATRQRLDRAEHEDSGRGLEFVWVNLETGFAYLAPQALHARGLLDGQVLSDHGSALELGVGAGARLLFLTLGARGRVARAADWDLWTLNGEVGLHLPYGSWEPAFSLSAGYASLSGRDPGPRAPDFDASQIGISGFNARLGAALEWYVDPLVSLGAASHVDLLALSRAGHGPSVPGLENYAIAGNGVGLGFGVNATVGLHF